MADALRESELALLASRTLPPAIVADGGGRELGSLVYSVVPGYRPLKLDLYVPPTTGAPVVVYVHGGAFMLGDRGVLPPVLTDFDLFHRLPAEGIAVASIDYRLSGEALFPAQIHDVRAAIRWLRQRSLELGIDGERIGIWGESAGGHLAALAGVTSPILELEGETGVHGTSSAVAAVVDWYGPTDFAAMDDQAPPDSAMRHDNPHSPESLLLGAPVQTVLEAVQSANPCAYASSSAPPFLIQHGTRDRYVPYGQSVLLEEALRAVDVDVELHAVDGADHVFAGLPDTSVVTDPVLAFLRRIL
jgi:acetyl esterase/lipase